MDDPNHSTTDEERRGAGTRWADELGNPLEAVKQVALAGLGAVAVAVEATDDMFQVLIRKGEETREEAIRDIREARARNADKRAGSEAFIRARMDSVLNKVNLASKGDIDALNAKLNIITRKLDEVQVGGSTREPAEFRDSASEPPAPPELPTSQP